MGRRQERQLGTAISGAVSAARRRPPQKRSDRANGHTQRERAAVACAVEHYATRAPRASRRRGSGGRAPRSRDAAARMGRRQKRQLGAAISGTVSTARRRPPQRRSDRANDHAQRERAGVAGAVEHYATRALRASCRRRSGGRGHVATRAAARLKRSPCSVTNLFAPRALYPEPWLRAWRTVYATDRVLGSTCCSRRCRAPRDARTESKPPPRKRRPSATPPRARRHD